MKARKYAKGGGPTDPKKKGSKAPAGTTKSPTGRHSVAPQGFIPGVSKQSNPNMLGYSAADRYNRGKIGGGEYFVESVKEVAGKLKKGKEAHIGGYANGGKIGEPLKMDASAKAAMKNSAVSKKKKPALRGGSISQARYGMKDELEAAKKVLGNAFRGSYSKGGKIYAEGGGPTDPKKKTRTPEQRKALRQMDIERAHELDKQIAEVDERLRNSAKTRQWVDRSGRERATRGSSITVTKRYHPLNPNGKTRSKYNLGEIKDMLKAERDYALSTNPLRKRRRPVPIFKEGDTGGIATEIRNKRFNPLASPKSGTIRRQTPPMKP